MYTFITFKKLLQLSFQLNHSLILIFVHNYELYLHVKEAFLTVYETYVVI